MARARPLVASIALVTLSSGCIVDGALRVRGTVTRERAGVREPIEGAVAKVTATDRKVGGDAPPATTDAAGRFEVLYRFGGFMILFVGPGDGRPLLEISAPGHAACTVEVTAKELPACATRRQCEEKGCLDFDVVLAPDGSAAASVAASDVR